MADIAVWGKHKFVVTPKVIQSFRDLKIKGESETEDKTASSQKYVSRKNGKPTEISFVVDLNALTGVKDVYGEAMLYVQEADDGKTDYFYLGNSKVLDIKVMLVKAEISEVVFVPGYGNRWISCSVSVTFKKASTKGGGTNTPSGSNGYTARVYYQLGSGASCYSVTAWSSVSYADALAKAKKKVPGGASWVGTSPKKAPATTQPTLSEATLEAARRRAQQSSQSKVPSAGLDKAKKISGN